MNLRNIPPGKEEGSYWKGGTIVLERRNDRTPTYAQALFGGHVTAWNTHFVNHFVSLFFSMIIYFQGIPQNK
jgi:hypothetical protein